MYKIEFQDISFLPSGYKHESLHQGELYAVPDIIVSVDTNWQGKIYPVQRVKKNGYNCKIYLRDGDFRDFQNIQYAKTITISDDESVRFMNLESMRVNDIAEIKEIDLVFSNETNVKIENIVLRSPAYSFQINDTLDVFTYNFSLPVNEISTFEQNTINDFNRPVNDYSRLQTVINIRFFVLDVNGFLARISSVIQSDASALIYNAQSYKDFTIETREVGYGLHEVNIGIIKASAIKQIW